MKPHHFCLLFAVLFATLGIHAQGQEAPCTKADDKIQTPVQQQPSQNPKPAKAGDKLKNLGDDSQNFPIESPLLDAAQILRIKQLLIEDYETSDKSTEQLDSSESPKILGVAWLDSHFQEVSVTEQGEKISIAVLTSGSSLGDPVSVTISADDVWISGKKCREITFTGVVNFENLALLKDLFVVVGEEGKMVVQPEWQTHYACKKFTRWHKHRRR